MAEKKETKSKIKKQVKVAPEATVAKQVALLKPRVEKSKTEVAAAKAEHIVRAGMKDALISPQKGRLVADLIRGMPAVRALDVLALTQKKAALIMRKVLVSAVANAQQNAGLDKKDLVISRILVDEGVKFPRYRIVSRGRGHRYVRRRSRIIIELTVKK